jgi:hypothetical protein
MISWILILVLGNGVHSQEFLNEGACKKAASAVQKAHWAGVTAVCAPKA